MTLELNTTRGITKCSAIAHLHIKNFHNVMLILPLLAEEILPELRQDTKNRQNSIDDIDPFVRQEFQIKNETL